MADKSSLPARNTFPDCRTCPMLRTGSAEVCSECAAETLSQAAEPSCEVCGQEMPLGRCGNQVCGWPHRGFGRVHTIAMYRDPLADCVKRLKYSGHTGWAIIFGRIIVGYLEAHASQMLVYNLIVPNPTFASPEPGRTQHTEITIDAARRADLGWWPFDQAPWALRKTAPTSHGAAQGWAAKDERARSHVDAIEIDTERIEGQRLLVYDDIFTTGLQLHYLAKKLRAHGATDVDGLALARAPWRS